MVVGEPSCIARDLMRIPAREAGLRVPGDFSFGLSGTGAIISSWRQRPRSPLLGIVPRGLLFRSFVMVDGGILSGPVGEHDQERSALGPMGA